MNRSPQPPEDEQKKKKETPLQAEAAEPIGADVRRKLNLLSTDSGDAQEAPSMGMLLIPFLFAAMEACWIDAIFLGLATLGFFQLHSPFMPLLVPFLMIAGSQWLYSSLVLRAARQHGGIEDFSEFSITPWFAPGLIVI